MRVLVIGGTLFIGKQLVKRLLDADHDVTILHRRAEHPFGRRVHNAVADRNDAASVRAALAGRKFDAVYDIAYDWARGTTGHQVEACARAIPGDLSRYVFMSSVAAYGDGLNHQEDDPLASEAHTDPYVRNKASSERALFRMYHESRFPVVTVRPSFVYGPKNPFYREAFFWDRLRAGRPLIVPGDGNRLMQFAFVSDLVEVCFRALDKPTAPGRAFNVGDDKALTQMEAVHAFAKAAGREAEVVRIHRALIARAGGKAFTEPFYFGEYFDLPPITMVIGRVKRVFNMTLTPFSEGLRETFKWYCRNGSGHKLNYALENDLIRQAREPLRASG
jgi:nucleoside-diphosphate-sugar epimerase